MLARDIAVIIESSTGYGRNLLSGISKFASLHGWRVRYEQRGLRDSEPAWLASWQGHGVITRSPDQKISRRLAEKGIPVIDLFTEKEEKDRCGTFVDSDHEAVGRQAADFFMGTGAGHFAFVGFSGSVFSGYRQRGFETALAAEGWPCLAFRRADHNIATADSERGRQMDFLASLPIPCAVFCATDELAARVVNDCHRLGIAVPEQAAVLGVDNDPLFCYLVSPSLSSVDPDIPRMGWEVAAWLEALMGGKDPEKEGLRRLIPPVGVKARESTSGVAAKSLLTARAFEAIRLNACRGAAVGDIAAACRVSRRTLERRFSEETGRTVKDLLEDTQVQHAKRFLLQTDYTLARIAALTGMNYPERLSHMFKRRTGITPGQFRRAGGPEGR